jgi:hypothetical protein
MLAKAKIIVKELALCKILLQALLLLIFWLSNTIKNHNKLFKTDVKKGLFPSTYALQTRKIQFTIVITYRCDSALG